MQTVDERLDRMIQLALLTGLRLDDIVQAIGRCDQSTFEAVSANPSRLPRYIQSKVRP